jgi:cytochrome P450
MTAPASHIQQLGDESSIWFKLTPLAKGPQNPMKILMQMAERYGGVIPVNMGSERVVLLTEPDHFKRVLVTKADDYIKYFDGLKPIFGKSMITHDGALWQKIRMPQQPAFHPDMFAEYIPTSWRPSAPRWTSGRSCRRPARPSRWWSRPGRWRPT